jgi:predicted permease
VDQKVTADARQVSPAYFATMKIPMRRGRVFDARDHEGQPGVVVVGESLAGRAWPGQEAVGQRLKIPLPETPYHDTWLTVVGVVADARYREVHATRSDFYMSFLQGNHRPNHLLVRTKAQPASVVPAIRELVRGLDKDQPVREAVTMTHVVAEALSGPRFAARVFGAFALAALLLAVLGLYGLLAYAVSQRTREIGVRVALGARPRDVRRLVLRDGLGLVAAGTALGLLAAFGAARLLTGLLYGVRPMDPATFAAVPVVLAAVTLLACLMPVRRASRVDPAVILRTE